MGTAMPEHGCYVKVQGHLLSKDAVLTTLSHSQKYIVVGLDNGQIHVIRASGESLYILQLADTIPRCSAIWEEQLVIGCTNGTIASWDLRQSSKHISFPAHDDTICSIIFRGPETITTCSRDFTVKVWTVEDWSCRWQLTGHSAPVVRIVADDKHIVSASHDCTCMVWDLQTGHLLHSLIGHKAQVCAVAMSKDKVISGDRNGEVRVWSRDGGSCLATMNRHSSLVSHICIREDLIVTADADRQIRACSLEDYKEVWAITQAHPHVVNSIQIRGDRILSGGSVDVCRVWRLGDGALISEVGEKSSAAWDVKYLEESYNIVHAFWDDGAALEILEISG